MSNWPNSKVSLKRQFDGIRKIEIESWGWPQKHSASYTYKIKSAKQKFSNCISISSFTSGTTKGKKPTSNGRLEHTTFSKRIFQFQFQFEPFRRVHTHSLATISLARSFALFSHSSFQSTEKFMIIFKHAIIFDSIRLFKFMFALRTIMLWHITRCQC